MNVTFCKDLNFEKTKDLTGYVIKIGVGFSPLKPVLYDPTKTGWGKYLGQTSLITHLIFKHMNATANVDIYPEICLRDTSNVPCVIFQDLIHDKIDFIMNPLFQHVFWNEYTYPIELGGLCAIAQMTERTTAEKFILIFPSTFWGIIISTGILSTFFLKFLHDQSICASVFEFVRMMLSMSSLKEPRRSHLRLLFTVFIFLTMSLNSYFQSRMRAMHMVPDANPTIESIQDLEKSNLIVYGLEDYKEFFQRSSIYSRYSVDDTFYETIDRLKRGDRISCIFMCELKPLVNVTNGTVHVAKHMIREIFKVLYAREDWPLLPKVDMIIRKMHESGLIKLFRSREKRLFDKHIQTNKRPWKEMNIKQLSVAFYCLISGFIIATCTFFIEIVLGKFILPLALRIQMKFKKI